MSSAAANRSRVARLGEVWAFSILDSIPLEMPERSASCPTVSPMSWRRRLTWLAMTHPTRPLPVSSASTRSRGSATALRALVADRPLADGLVLPLADARTLALPLAGTMVADRPLAGALAVDVPPLGRLGVTPRL
jgi:hypothetical protein